MKWGWRGSTIDISQRESTKVTRPPVPALLPVNASMRLKKAESRSVTVNDSHFDSSILRLKTGGRPKSGCVLASVSQSAHDPPGSFFSGLGAAVIDPGCVKTLWRTPETFPPCPSQFGPFFLPIRTVLPSRSSPGAQYCRFACFICRRGHACSFRMAHCWVARKGHCSRRSRLRRELRPEERALADE